MAAISVHLFLKPEMEMDLEHAQPHDFGELGDALQARLHRVAEIVEKLEKDGWERSAGLYDITFYKKITTSEKEALEKLGINENEVDIMEDDEFGDDDFEDVEASDEETMP